MADMEALAARVEALEGPDRAVDCLIAMATQGYSLFHSKHNYWTISKGRETVIWEWARHADWTYDPHTGKRLGEPEEPLDWAWEANLPEWTRSIDDAVSLVPKNDAKCWAAGWAIDGGAFATIGFDHPRYAATPALALTAAALRAIGQIENGKTAKDKGKPDAQPTEKA